MENDHFQFESNKLLDISDMEMVVFHHSRKLIYLPATLMVLFTKSIHYSTVTIEYNQLTLKNALTSNNLTLDDFNPFDYCHQYSEPHHHGHSL